MTNGLYNLIKKEYPFGIASLIKDFNKILIDIDLKEKAYYDNLNRINKKYDNIINNQWVNLCCAPKDSFEKIRIGFLKRNKIDEKLKDLAAIYDILIENWQNELDKAEGNFK